MSQRGEDIETSEVGVVENFFDTQQYIRSKGMKPLRRLVARCCNWGWGARLELPVLEVYVTTFTKGTNEQSLSSG
jgi:hypothetical protein